MPKRYNKRPLDYVRCQLCGRLTEKANAKKFNGQRYGSDCYKKAIISAEAEASSTS